MNKVIQMGRLVADPEIKYAGSNNTAIANFRIAVDRKFKKDGEQSADFFIVTAIGKLGEFAEKYLRKGTKIVFEGELRNNNYTNKDGQMVYQNQIIANSIEFAESKNAQSNDFGNPKPKTDSDGFMKLPDDSEESLPFN